MGARLRKAWFLWAFPAFLALSPAHAQPLVLQQPKGLNTESSPATLQNGQTPDSENVVTDLGPGLQPRQGFTLCNTSSSTAQWFFPNSNGTRYQIIQSGGRLLADTGGCTFAITVSTVDATAPTAGAALGDKFFFTNTTDGLKYWDTANVVVASATLKASQLAVYKDRLWASGLVADPRSIRASKFDDGTVWALAVDPVVTDPAVFVIGGAGADPLTTLYASHQDALVWMAGRAFGVVAGNSRADFTVRTYSDNVGTSYPDSVRNCDGLLRWLGPARTVYEWDGTKLENIGRDIQTYLGQIGQGDGNARTFTITSQSDYDSGVFYQKTSAITSGDLMLSTWTATDTSTTDFNGGSFSNTFMVVTDTNTPSSGRVELSTNDTNVLNNSAETSTDGFSQDADHWTGGLRTNAIAKDGSFSLQTGGVGDPTNIILNIENSSGTVLGSFNYTFSTLPLDTWVQESANLAPYAGIYIQLGLARTGVGDEGLSEPFVCSGSTMTFWLYRQTPSGPIFSRTVYFDLFQGGRSSIVSGTFTSHAFNTALSSAAWILGGVTSAAGSAMTFQTQSSSDGTTWQTAVAWSTTTLPASDFRQYIRYVVTIATGPGTSVRPYVDDVTLAARANYGAYISTNISLGSISSFGLFGANTDSDGGTVTYAVYSDSNTSMNITNGIPTSGFVSSQTITSGSYVTLSTSPYIRMGEVETITVSTNNPTNHLLSVAWAEGNTTKVPSAWFRQRYWLGVGQNSATNNKVLVFDRDRQWQRYSGINASSLVIYNGALFFGNLNGVFQYETGYSDAGSAIAAYYRTGTMSPAGPNLSSFFNDLQVTADSSVETAVTTFRVNDVATDYSLRSYVMNTAAGLQNFRLSFPFSQVQSGRNINFKFAVSGTTFWRILGGSLDFTPDLVPE